MKKAIVIALLAAFCYNLVGFIAAFRIIRSEWRHAIWAELAVQKDAYFLTTFHFSKKQFDPKTHEFRHEGQMYDVVELENWGTDSLKVVCFNDQKETELTQNFDTILLENANKRSEKSQKTQFLFSRLLKDYLFDNSFSFKIPPSVPELFLAQISFQAPYPTVPFLECLAPPPRV